MTNVNYSGVFKVNDYINPEWLTILNNNDLESFEALWNLKAPWFEPPNKRRGGWSGVSRILVKDNQGKERALFLKRQENHLYKPLRNLIKGAPTFRREMKNMRRFAKHKIPIPMAVYYGERTVNGKIRAILITESIAPAYRALEDWLQTWQEGDRPHYEQIQAITKTLAESIAKMHSHSIKHGALLPKHIFLNEGLDNHYSVRFIDLEKTRYWFLPYNGVNNDLRALARGIAPYISKTRMLSFYKMYNGSKPFNERQRAWIKEVGQRIYKTTTK